MPEYIYYCPTCEKLSTVENTEFKTPKLLKCDVCDKARILISSVEDWKFLKSESANNWTYEKTKRLENAKEEYKKIVERKKYVEEVLKKAEEKKDCIVVTTGDLKNDYEIIGPVYFQLNDAGAGTLFRKYLKKYDKEIEKWKGNRQGSDDSQGLSEYFSNVSAIFNLGTSFDDRDYMGNDHANFDSAFYICLQELKLRAACLNADAIIEMRQELNLDSHGFQRFYMQMYGTAVKFKSSVTPNSI